MKTTSLNTFNKVTAQSSVGEAVKSSATPAKWFALVALPTNTGTIHWGFSADQCLFHLDYSFPFIPGQAYDLSKIFIKTSVNGEGVVVAAAN